MKKMSKKLLLMLLIVLFLCGCDINVEKGSSVEYSTGGELYYDYDKTTCVEYIEFVAGYKGGLSVRYNADGTIRLNQDCLEGKDKYE